MRIFGAALVALSSVLAGCFLSRRLSYAADACEKLLRVMKYVRDEIAVNKTPTHIIISRLQTQFGVPASDRSELYGAFEPELGALSAEENEIFRQFCGQIGKGGAEVQRSQFDALITRFGEISEKRRTELSKNSRLYVSVALFIGVLIIIIMI